METKPNLSSFLLFWLFFLTLLKSALFNWQGPFPVRFSMFLPFQMTTRSYFGLFKSKKTILHIHLPSFFFSKSNSCTVHKFKSISKRGNFRSV
ncbi:hypothetical protein POPTR_010G096850v4 [Populus trichocarpa]|uniref:Uncharacterized protein n=1 Tax=Populus trichocarpa TaxID=3694 RepID=A0ACC0SCD5_POPTR|nr:hypothetical protein POPTR_010G096850v4 [Populus trichocarpa]